MPCPCRVLREINKETKKARSKRQILHKPKAKVKEVKNGTMSNRQAREWYNEQLEKLKLPNEATEASAKEMVNKRNALKLQARDLMKDRLARKKLDKEAPIQDFDYYVKKYQEQGYEGKALWKRIIKGSKTPTPKVNKKFNIHKKEPEE